MACHQLFMCCLCIVHLRKYLKIPDSICMKKCTAGIRDFLTLVDYLKHYERLSLNSVCWPKQREKKGIFGEGEVELYEDEELPLVK